MRALRSGRVAVVERLYKRTSRFFVHGFAVAVALVLDGGVKKTCEIVAEVCLGVWQDTMGVRQ